MKTSDEYLIARRTVRPLAAGAGTTAYCRDKYHGQAMRRRICGNPDQAQIASRSALSCKGMPCRILPQEI